MSDGKIYCCNNKKKSNNYNKHVTSSPKRRPDGFEPVRTSYFINYDVTSTGDADSSTLGGVLVS